MNTKALTPRTCAARSSHVHDLEEGGAGRRLEAMSKAIDVSDRTGIIMCQGARVPDTGICVFFARLGGWCLSPRGGPGVSVVSWGECRYDAVVLLGG